ncbi:MAG: CBS domain-containing protein [Desulfovibrionaceae bacterium]|nr:CBS domain-containing protein [Desulfovibrionaceae bacterium]
MLRKRAWDIMHEDFITMTEEASVLDAMRGLASSPPGCLAVLVTAPDGTYKGTVSSWDMVRFVSTALQGADAYKDVDDEGFEAGVGAHCKKCGITGVSALINPKTPVARPGDPLLVLMEAMVKSGQRLAVVKEGDKVMGVISLTDVFKELAQGMVPED